MPGGVTADLATGIVEADGMHTLTGVENFIGSEHRDVINGDDRANVLHGGPGRDRISGGGGDDNLIGGRGPDSLDGGPGDDSLDGGPHDNVNEGGEGIDYCINPDRSGGATGCELP